MILYHNTTNRNGLQISKEGIKCDISKSIKEYEGNLIWATNKKQSGYGSCTVSFNIPDEEAEKYRVNTTDYMIPRDIDIKDIIDIDYVVWNNGADDFRVSDIQSLIRKYGIETVERIITTKGTLIEPFNKENADEELRNMKLLENKKLEEVSRNELLAKAKGETITRYKKSAGYKGFTIRNIDTTNLLRDNTIVIECNVGKYVDTLELEDVLYWIQICAEENQNRQINAQGVIKAIMNAVDGMDIKVDCSCPDFCYRFAWEASEWGYKYGKQETRPANITNPNGFGSCCKHILSMLSNKQWLQQVGSVIMDWCVKNIDEINQFLELEEDKWLTLPNELARLNAKSAYYGKLFKDKLEEPEDEEEKQEVEQAETIDDLDNEKEQENERVTLDDIDKDNEE